MKASASLMLKKAYEKKRAQSPQYSLRQIAKRLGVSAPYLSQILNGKKPLSLHLLEELCVVLDIDREKRDRLLAELISSKGVRAKISKAPSSQPLPAQQLPADFVPEKFFWVLEEWFHLPILNATLLADYDGTAEFVANHLGLPQPLVQASMDKMKAAGFLEEEKGVLRKSQIFNDFHSSAPGPQIRKFHADGMIRAQKLLAGSVANQDLEARLITSMVFTMAESDIPWVKQEISQFMQSLLGRLSQSQAQKVYRLGIQLFPHSK